MAIRFDKEQGIGKVLFDWWQGLANDPGGRASLRRAATITEVTLTPVYQRLHRRLRLADGAGQIQSHHQDALAAVAGLLAHVRQDDARSLAQGMSASPDGGDKPRVSELRFLRLLDTGDIDTLFTALRRVLPLMNHEANVIALANDIVRWGDVVKKQWAYDYDWPPEPAE